MSSRSQATEMPSGGMLDFGEQDEYQLVHQMFLHNTTLAPVLIDPTDGREVKDEARGWNRRVG